MAELEKVHVQDIDRTLQTMHIRFAKGGSPRVVPLGHHAVQWLGTYLDRVRPTMVKGRPFERALFVVRGGRSLGQTQTRSILHRYRKTAHLRKTVTPHILRHSCATHLLRAGANLRTIQELLGHSRLVSTTIYTRVAPMEVKAMHQRYHPGNAEHAAD